MRNNKKLIVRKAVVNNLNDVLKLVRNTDSTLSVHESFLNKGIFNIIIIEKIDNREANILKQEAIAVGADAAVSKDVSRFVKGFSDVVLFATIYQIQKLVKKLKLQCFNLKNVALELNDIIKPKQKIFKYKKNILDLSLNPVVMGIINIDPCSFSGDGFTDSDAAFQQAIKFEELGVGIIDIGAESSRPGSKFLDATTEINRLLPVLKKIRRRIKIPISVDTYKYETAKVVLSEGADIINDIFALKNGKSKLAKLISATKAGLIIMHMKGIPENMQTNPKYVNCTSEVYKFLSVQKKYAMKFGIGEEYIAVDPGIGFGKSTKHNVELIKNISVFSTLGPVIGALSRKRFIKSITNNDDTTSLVISNFLIALYGADIIRIHDVAETMNAIKIIKALREI